MGGNMRFEGKCAVVAGAGGGMGLAISMKLIKAGARVCMLDLKEAPEEIRAYGDAALFLRGDVTEEEFVMEAIAKAASTFRHLDYLVNATGVLWFDRDVSVLDVDLEVWDRVLAINLTSFALTIRHVVPEMRKIGGGAIVNISSIDALVGDTKPQDAYGASKAAVIRLSKSVAIQLAEENIRSNTILPGPVYSPMQKRWDDEVERDKVAHQIPVQRIGTPDDVAAACLFLLSDEASFITGTELIVDGGVSARA